jgi:hypothetical protein
MGLEADGRRRIRRNGVAIMSRGGFELKQGSMERRRLNG